MASLLLAVGAGAQPALIVPGDNLLVEGVPPLPAALAEEVGRYTEFRSAALQAWHPLRREILITTRFADTPQVHSVPLPGGARTQLTFYPDAVNGASFPPRDRGFFVFTKDVGGGEWYQHYRFDLPGGAITLLTDGRSRNGAPVWSTAGDRLAYNSTRRNGKDTDLYLMDPADPRTDRRLAEVEGGGWSPLDWSPDDRQLLVFRAVSAGESYLWLFDVATGQRTLVTPKTGPETVAYGTARFAADGRSLYVTTDRESEFQRLARLELATGAHTALTSHIPWDVDRFELSPDGRTLAFVTNEDGTDVLRLLDTASGKERRAPSVGPGLGVIGDLAWHENGRELGFSFASARSPSDVYSVEVTSGRLERWTWSETGGLDAAGFSEPQLVRWPSFDGRTISGYLYRPAARFTGRRPIIISIHGGPEGQARPRFLGRPNYYLNELGVALLYPNVRGSSGYGKTFLTLDNGERREDSVKDVGALLDWIAAQPDLDPGRVMVTGASYGGYMTLAVATRYDERIRCAVDVVGVSNFVTFLERTESYRRDLRRVEYGDERDPKMRAFLLSIAPVNNAQKITKPLFVVQGRNDPRVPYTESEQMVATVRRNGTPVWYLMARDEGHGFDKKKNLDFQFYATVAFVREHLLK